MRFSLFVLAAVAGIAAAQDSDAGLQTCIDGCTQLSLSSNPVAAQKCLATDDKQQQAACMCQETELLTAMQSCITKACPDLSGDVDLAGSCKGLGGDNGSKPSDDAPTTPNQTGGQPETTPGADTPKGAASHTSVGMLPVLAASGALALGALLL